MKIPSSFAWCLGACLALACGGSGSGAPNKPPSEDPGTPKLSDDTPQLAGDQPSTASPPPIAGDPAPDPSASAPTTPPVTTPGDCVALCQRVTMKCPDDAQMGDCTSNCNTLLNSGCGSELLSLLACVYDNSDCGSLTVDVDDPQVQALCPDQVAAVRPCLGN